MAMPSNPRILAGLWAGYTVLTTTVVLVSGLAFGLTCAPFFGMGSMQDPDTYAVYAGASGGFACVVLGLGALSLGICWGLYKEARWGVWGALLLAILNLFAVPVGTALAIFTFVALKEQLGMGGRTR